MKLKKYKVVVYVSHIEIVEAENEAEAHEKAESKVFEEKVNWETGNKNNDLITGYKVIKLK